MQDEAGYTVPEVQKQQYLQWGIAILAAALAALSIAVAWATASPWTVPICPAIYPAPYGCSTSARVIAPLVVSVLAPALSVAAIWPTQRNAVHRYVRVVSATTFMAVLAAVTHIVLTWFLAASPAL